MSSTSDDGPWVAVEQARAAWRQVDAQIPQLRAVHGDLSSLHDAVTRNKPDRARVEPVLTELERLGGDSDEQRRALGFIADPLFEGDRTVGDAFRHGRAVTGEADAVASALSAYVDGGDWAAVRSAITAVVEPGDGPMAIDTVTLEQVVTLFGLAIDAGVAAREANADDLSTALADIYTDGSDPIADLEEQPVALLPVRLETRFVDDNRGTDGDAADLLVRVFPDQVHVDSHEEELTDDEVRWGQNFWATMWYARHPDPSAVLDDPSAEYLQKRLPNERLRELVTNIDPAKFSDAHHKRYRELKERAWSQVHDRFGRERAAYVVHALEPTDEDLAADLLTPPDPPPELMTEDYVVQTQLETLETAEESEASGDDSGDGSMLQKESVVSEYEQQFELTEGAPAETAVPEDLQQGSGAGDDDEKTDGGDQSESETEPGDKPLPKRLPALAFPTVSRRPASWTQQPRASMLPDRWVAIAEWEDGQGTTNRTAVASAPVREPLAVGPSPESVAAEELESDTDTPAPERTEWMVDFEEAKSVGMGLELHLSGLSGFDAGRGFTRLLVVGVKASMGADETPDALVDLLDAHHYTDGLELLEGGTPTNNHDGSSGYSRSDDPAESMTVECVPPLVESGDRSDGDLLARALAIDGDDHVFANVKNADGTQQRDGRHMNSALWPSTLGYFVQDLALHNKFTDNRSLRGGANEHLTGAARRQALSEPMLWHDAYRRHFVRYVRGQGPFPAMRVGKQPYGILPASATETDLDVSIVDHVQVAKLQRGEIGLADLERQETSTADLVNSGISPATMLDAGASPDELLEAGADPKKLVAGGVDPETIVDTTGLAPDALTQDGIGLLATSQVTRSRLEAAGVPVEDLEAAGVTVRDLSRGNVTDEQLAAVGVTTKAVADVVLPEKAKSLGITPAALERAGVTPAALLSGEVSADQIEALGLSTRTVADAILPQAARELGITPKTLVDAGITPQDLANGTVSAADLQRAGVSTEALAEALLPQEVKDFGITPAQVGDAVSVAELFNGNVGVEDLQAAGLTTQNLADAVLPQSFRDAGITPESLETAGITPDAVLNGQVTPEDVMEAGVTPKALADAGVLPDALSDVGHAVDELLDAGLQPTELLDRGLTPQSLVDAGVDPGLLVDAGLAPKKLIDAGVDALELAAKSAAPLEDLASAGGSVPDLARVGATVADLAGGDVPAQELVKAGFTAVDVLEAGADALGVAQGGARPTELRDAGVDAGTLREAGKAAGSLQLAGYSAEEALQAGYTPEELLNGGFSPQELTAAGVDPETVESAGRAVEGLLAAGHPPGELRASGYSPQQLLDAGLDAAQLVAAGYTAGELKDAGIPTERLAEAGVPVGELRAAGAEVSNLADAGVDPASLRDAGASAEELIDHGFDPQALLEAGFESVELEVAGVDVDQLAEDVATGEADTGAVADAALEGLQYAATVLEDPNQAERDLYSFSFDPALPTLGAQPDTGPEPSPSAGDEAAGEPDGGVAGGVPVVRPLAVDDRLPGELEARIEGIGPRWATAAEDLPFAGDTDEGGLLNALKRTGLSADLRQQTMVYSGEQIDHSDPLNQLVRRLFDPESATKPLIDDLSRNGDLDPRIGHFHATDASRQQAKSLLGSVTETLPQQFYQYHTSYPTKGTIPPHELVDGDIEQFVDVLLDSTLSDVEKLSHRIDPGGLSLDTSVFDDVEWSGLGAGEKRGRIVNGIETADDPYGFASRLLGNSAGDAPGYHKIRQMGENQARNGDSGALRSVLRLLLQHGLLREYIAARRRLGMAYDDLPDGWPDPAYYDGNTRGPLASLYDEAPTALSSHPNVGTADGGSYTYADALQDAAANYNATTSIDPRLSEFTDSVRYLAGLDPADLSRLARETLDLANHRLDAWWTSLATKRLFELREAQGTYDSEAGFDHEAWSGGGSDVPRATVDPGLLSSMATEPSTASETDQQDASAATSDDQGSGTIDTAITKYDPVNVRDAKIDATALGSQSDPSDPETDGGMDPLDNPSLDPTTGKPIGSGQLSGTGQPADSPVELSRDNVAVREPITDRTTVRHRVESDPGIYVGGYGFVENLSADTGERDDPEYIHAPSEQHATTAAILRSGADAHDADEGDNPLSVDLSADRVRDGLRLVRGVRRGQSLGELLGYRFERELHEETVSRGPAVNLVEHLDTLRAEFPATHGKLKRPDERTDDAKSERAEELAAREALDGYQLVKQWDDYPFGRGDLPGQDTTEYDILDGIVTGLADRVDAAGDLLTAESVHQLGQGNFQRAGGSVGALGRGEPLPDPQVARTPRSETGVTHRQCVLFGTSTVSSDASPRSAAEPVLATWIESQLPAHDTVECTATYRWTETTTDQATGTTREIERTAPTSATLADLDLGPLDILNLFGADRSEGRSELEQRLAYRLLRDRPSDPPVPADADVELELTETPTDGATSMADLLELARSLREFVQSARPVNAQDLAHPADRAGEGYDQQTAATLTSRADDAQDTLRSVASTIDERIAVLDPEHEAGDGLAGIPTAGASADGGASGDVTGDSTGGVTLPKDSPTSAEGFDRPTLTGQVTALQEAIDSVEDTVPFSAVESLATSLDADAVRPELRSLVETLPAGLADPEAVTEDVTVQSAGGQAIEGTLGESVQVPEVATADQSESEPSDSGEGMLRVDYDPTFWTPSGQTRGGSTLGPSPAVEETVALDERPEIELGEPQWLAETARPSESAETGDTESSESARDWSTTPATVRAWGTDGLSWFEVEETTTPAADGSFSVDLDFSGVSPGTPFHVVAVVDDAVAYSSTGRVVADDVSSSTQSTLENDCPTLQQLLWLRDRQDRFSVENGASAALDLALESIDWSGVKAERDAADPSTSTVTQADVNDVDALVAVEGLDPESLASSVDTTVAPVGKLGLDRIVDVTGEGDGPTDAEVWYGPTAALGEVRARITRTLDNPALFNDGAAPWLLGYHHDAAATLHAMQDGSTVAAYLDAFLAQPGWTIRYLDRKVPAPATLVRDLTAWLYSPRDLSGASTLSTALEDLAATVTDLPALEALFEGLPTGSATTRREAFKGHLKALAGELGDTPPTLSDASTATLNFDAARSTAASTLASTAQTERSTIAPVVDARVDRSFRRIVLERLREPMTVAASYGVYGGTPESADGGHPADERQLLEQARALLQRLRSRLQSAAGLDPRVEGGLKNRPVPQRVEDQTDRLTTLFGDGFTVLPPFSPTNPKELTATFTDDGLVPDGATLAAETWLQRAATFRDGVAEFREARSYAEAVTGSLTASLTVGQLPYDAGDTWIGVDGVQPKPGRLSLVAQFGPDVTPGTANGRLTGLFVDEWTEGVPSETETTGLALNYDEPGTRAPQSILLATPPDDGNWSLDELASVVAETADYAKRRAVDLGDMAEVTRLLPGLYFGQQLDPEPTTPTVDFRMLDWYDRKLVTKLQPPALQLRTVESEDGGSP